MAIETIANLTGQFDQFGKRVERVETESDNTRRELTDAINGLRADNQALLVRIDAVNEAVNNKVEDINKDLVTRMDAGFQDLRSELKQEIQSAKQEFGNTRNWQISCVIAAVIAVCAVVGLLIK